MPRSVSRSQNPAEATAVRPVGQQLILEEHQTVSEFEKAKPIMTVALVLGVVFGLWAWFKGSGRLKTFT